MHYFFDHFFTSGFEELGEGEVEFSPVGLGTAAFLFFV
jgi:hypothetical protein